MSQVVLRFVVLDSYIYDAMGGKIYNALKKEKEKSGLAAMSFFIFYKTYMY